jgi:hypothetical protein
LPWPQGSAPHLLRPFVPYCRPRRRRSLPCPSGRRRVSPHSGRPGEEEGRPLLKTCLPRADMPRERVASYFFLGSGPLVVARGHWSWGIGAGPCGQRPAPKRVPGSLSQRAPACGQTGPGPGRYDDLQGMGTRRKDGTCPPSGLSFAVDKRPASGRITGKGQRGHLLIFARWLGSVGGHASPGHFRGQGRMRRGADSLRRKLRRLQPLLSAAAALQ